MKKFLAAILSIALILSMMPASVFANTETPSSDKTLTVALTDPPGNGYFVWDGKAKTPEVTITTSGGTALAKGTDYNLKYENNVNPGEAAVTATGIGTYEDYTGTVTFQIKKSLTSVSLQTPATVVSGTEIKIEDIVLTDDGKTLTADTDYTFADDENTTITADHKTLTIKAGSDSYYFGERTIEFTIGTDISTATVTVPDLTYTGKEQTAAPTVYLGSTRLYQNTDYIVTGNKATGAGTYTLTITGIGKYAGTKTADYTVKPKDLKYVTIPSIDNQIAGVVPEPMITDGTKTLVKGADYTLSYANNGTAGNTATLTVTGMGNYTGTVTRTFLVKEGINDATVYYTKTGYDYTGYAVYPEIQVKSTDPKKTYVLNRDYKIVGGGKTDAGFYTFTLVGMGSYGGEFYQGTYIINKASLTTKGAAALYDDTFTYAGKKIEPSVTVTCSGRTLRKDIDYTVSYLNNNRIGTASVIISGTGNYTGSITKTFRIIGKDLSQVTGVLSQTSYQYDGLEKKPQVTLYDGAKRLTSGIDYTVSYDNNKNAGTGEVIVTGKGNYGGTKTLTFRIIGKSQTVTTRYTRYTKTLNSASFNLRADHDGDGTLIYRSSDPSVAVVSSAGQVTVTGTGQAVITVSTTGTVKYDPASKAVYVTVKPLKPAVTVTSPAKKQLKVTITKVKGATKYQVKYGRNGVYYNRYITHRDNSYKKVYTVIGSRLSGKNYYVKVRAYKTLDDGTKVWGDWTTLRKVKVK